MTINASNWRPSEPITGGTVGGDGAGESVQVEYRNPDLPNARITVDTYVISRTERGNEPWPDCVNCGKQIELDDGVTWWHPETGEAFCDPEGHPDHGIWRQAEPGPDWRPWDVETMTTFSLVDAAGEETECVAIDYAHAFDASFATEERATEARDGEVARWQQWHYDVAPIFTWDGSAR